MMHFFTKQIITASLIALFFLFSDISNATEKLHKRYPPYPEVWGYDLYVPDAAVDTVYKTENGDILFALYTYKDKRNQKTGFLEPFKEKCILLKFFSGEKVELDPSECEKKIDNKELGKLGYGRAHFTLHVKLLKTDSKNYKL